MYGRLFLQISYLPAFDPLKGMGLPMSDRPPGWVGLMSACWSDWPETQK